MKLYWSHCAGSRNFGDILGPVLLRLWGFKVDWAMPEQAELVTVGSVISKFPNGWRGTVLGTGTIRAGIHRDLSRARVLSVRGALTRDACHLPKSTPLGDMGILAPDLLGAAGSVNRTSGGSAPDGAHPAALHPIGVLGHHIDRDIAGRHPGAFIINIRGGAREVVAAAASCEFLVVSSLHALILADALAIPHLFEPHPRVIGCEPGQGFWKFRDYGTSVGQRIVPGVTRLTPRAIIAEKQAEIRRLVAQLEA